MATSVTEFFYGGVVTSRHPALLQENELQKADDCVYRDNDSAIWRAPGRWPQVSSAIESSGGTPYPVKGLTYLTFDGNIDDQIVAYVNNSLYYAPVTSVKTETSGSNLVFKKVTGPGIITASIPATKTTWPSPVNIPGLLTEYWTLTVEDGTIVGNELIGAVCTVSGKAVNIICKVMAVIPASEDTKAKIALDGHPVVVGASSMYWYLTPSTGTKGGDYTYKDDGTDNPPPFTNIQFHFSFGVPQLFNNISSSLSTIFYGTSYYILNGSYLTKLQMKGSSYLMNVPCTLMPVTGRPILRAASDKIDGLDPVWPKAQGTGIYWVMLTEIISEGTNEIESSYLGTKSDGLAISAGDPVPIEINSLQKYIEIKTPPVLNNGLNGKLKATHWAVYLSTATADLSVKPSLASFRRVIKVAMTDYTPYVTNVQVGSGSPKAVNTIQNTAFIDVLNNDRENFAIGATICQIINNVNIYSVFQEGTVITKIGQRGPSLTRIYLSKAPLTTGSVQNVYVQTGTHVLIVGNQQKFPESGEGFYVPTVIEAGSSFRPDLWSDRKAWAKQDFFNPFYPRTMFGNLDDIPYSVTGDNHTVDGYLGLSVLGGWVHEKTQKILSFANGTLSGIKGEFVGDKSRDKGTDWAWVTPYINHQFGLQQELRANNHPQGFGGEQNLLGLNIEKGATGNALKLIVEKNSSSGNPGTLYIRSIKLQFYLSSGVVNFNGVPYRVVTYRDQIGTAINDPVNLPAPKSTTGDFFQGSLVLNDIDFANTIRFSYPGKPEAFPKPYYIRFNSSKRDTITYIKRLGASLIVGFTESIKRVNYLPKETDTDLQSGISHEDISSDHGIPGPDAAVKFDMPGEGTVLAYVNATGIFVTNGLHTRPLSIDLDWKNTVKISALSTCILKAYPKEKWLALYYCPAGAAHNRNTRVMYFCYQADKIKAGSTLPAVGPSKISAMSVCNAVVSEVPYIFTGSEIDGKIYCEDNGIKIPTGYQTYDLSNIPEYVTICPVIKTRRIYHGGYNRDARVEQVLLLYSPYGTTNSFNSIVAETFNQISIPNSSTAIVGARINKNDYFPLGTIILSNDGPDPNNPATRKLVTLSNPAIKSTPVGEIVTLSADTGCVSITIEGTYTNSVSTGTATEYVSTRSGDLLSCHADHIRQGMEIEISKVATQFNGNLIPYGYADLNTNMRLHHHTSLITEIGAATNRTAI